MVITRLKEGGDVEEGVGGINGDRDLTWGSEHIIQYTHDVL